MSGAQPFLARLAALGLLLAVAAPLRAGDSPPPRGPVEIRDEQLFAQPRLTLPAVSPWTTPPGRWAVSASFLWSNSFSWDQDVPGESPADRRFLVDGEALTGDVSVRRGLSPRLDVALRLPVRWRGGGAMDGLIDWWHRAFGLPDAHRPDFETNAFRVEGRTRDGEPFAWNEADGGGLGDVEAEVRWRLADAGPGTPAFALVGRASAPTGGGPFAGNGFGAGLQAVVSARLGRRVDLYAGAGATAQAGDPVRGVAYHPVRAHGFVALEWRPSSAVSLVAETNAAARLVENVERYPGTHWVIHLAGRFDVGEKTRLDVGVTENVKSQLTTTDFALYAAVVLRP